MGRQDYIDKLLDHYESPRYQGVIAEADVVVSGRNPGCGDVITIYLCVGEDNIAREIRFEGEGCTISQGAVSILLEMVQGKPLAEIEAIDYNDLIENLGKGVVLSRVRCAILGLQTLKEAIQRYYARQLQPLSS
jgi:nitrogen fixation NifU-like protein